MIYVDDLGDQRIRIRDVRNGKTVDRVVDFATWKATIGPGGAITFRDMCNPDRYITGNIDNLIIDGEPAPADDEYEVSKKLWFISSLSILAVQNNRIS